MHDPPGKKTKTVVSLPAPHPQSLDGPALVLATQQRLDQLGPTAKCRVHHRLSDSGTRRDRLDAELLELAAGKNVEAGVEQLFAALLAR